MALIILSLSGCEFDHRSSNPTGSSTTKNNTTTTSNVMVLNAVTFAKGETYKLYKGSGVTTSLGNSAKYYVAPITISVDPVTMNLDFASTLTSGEPFVVCDSTDTVVFAYNPNGLGNNFASKNVKVTSDTTGQLSYSSLALSSVSTSSLTTGYEYEDPIEIVLTASDTARVTSGSTTTTLSAIDCVWNVTPDKGEYWTMNNIEYTDESDVQDVISSGSNYVDGVYIARDIRYVPGTLEFKESQTAAKAKDDTESMYVAYYNEGATLDDQTVDADNKWIIAALPTSMGNAQPGGDMGGGGTPPDGSTGGPGGGTDGGTPPSGVPGGSFAPSAVTSFSDIVKAMTHSASDALDNPVLHITKAGTYKISGTWNGQIWVDADKKSHVILILNGVTVNCSVAPALVFKKVLEYGPETSSDVASDYSSKTFSVGPNLAETDEDEVINAGATVVLVSGTTNTFTGTNVARINKIEINDDDEYNDESLIGKYVKAQSKMYKLDGAVHSRMSLVIADDGSSSTTPGKLIVKSDYEGLDSEMHMYIESGNISVTADDDGINVNEDDVSVFHMDGGTLTINSSGGDGIDSNGYLIFKGGTLNITAGSSRQNSAGEAGIDAEKGVYIYSDSAYTWSAAGSSTTIDDGSGSSTTTDEETGSKTTTQKNSDGSTTETTTNSDGSSTSTTKDSSGNTTDTVTTNTDGSSTTTVTNAETGKDVATITLKASSSEITRSTLTADQRRAQGVLSEGTNFKLVDTNNDFGGVK